MATRSEEVHVADRDPRRAETIDMFGSDVLPGLASHEGPA